MLAEQIFLIDRSGAFAETTVTELIWRVTDDNVKLHVENPLWMISMNEFVGVAFQLTAAVVLISLSAAVDASITSPHMLDGLVMDMPVRSVEHVIDRIFAVRFFGTIQCST